MVSHAEPGRTELFPLKARWVLLLGGGLLASLLGCSRRAEIEEPIVSEVPSTPEVPFPEDGIPAIEASGLEVTEGSCEARPGQSACAGANDFTCAFDRWLGEVSDACQIRTGCRTNGWLEVVTSAEGCASELRMEQPNPDFVACMSELLNQHRCATCSGVSASRFLGAALEGCEPEEIPCRTGELRCPPGLTCQGGSCVEGAGGDGGS